MEIEYTIFATDAIQDRKRGTWSIINVFDSINFNTTPASIQNFVIFARIKHESNENIIVKIVNEGSGKELAAVSKKLELKPGTENTNLSITIRGLIFPEPGNYNFEFYNKGEKIFSAILKVNVNSDE